MNKAKKLKRVKEEKGQLELEKCLEDLTKKSEEILQSNREFSETNRELTSIMGELIKEVKENTFHSIKLKAEVRKQREVDEKNIEFLQSLVKDFLTTQKSESQNKWEIIKKVLNWALKIAAVVILAAMGIKIFLPDGLF
jgi:hypothetical protein